MPAEDNLRVTVSGSAMHVMLKTDIDVAINLAASENLFVRFSSFHNRKTNNRNDKEITSTFQAIIACFFLNY